jgi:uncharacterized protein (TIGR02757 family)
MQFEKLKNKLDELYVRYKRKYSSKDPVWILHKLKDPADIEIMGLITSAYSYGQVELINRFTEKLLNAFGNKPHEFTINFSKRKDKKYLEGLSYRFNTHDDLLNLLNSLHLNLSKYRTLENLFLKNYDDSHKNIIPALTGFSAAFNSTLRSNRKSGRYYHFLISNPENNSTCKRMNMFLRWMVRKDEIDLGLWKKVSPSKLIMPVDVHIARISRSLKLVKRRSVDLTYAIELTETLKKFDPDDPVKYDFALCHIEMEGNKIKF